MWLEIIIYLTIKSFRTGPKEDFSILFRSNKKSVDETVHEPSVENVFAYIEDYNVVEKVVIFLNPIIMGFLS